MHALQVEADDAGAPVGRRAVERQPRDLAEPLKLWPQWRASGAALTEALMALCRTTLAPYKYPRWVEYVTDLPKTATGKIQRFKLRD